MRDSLATTDEAAWPQSAVSHESAGRRSDSASWCFSSRRPQPPTTLPAPATGLRPPHAEALARLIPILGCGEEAATLAFDGLARAGGADRVAAAALRQVAAEERTHDGLMHSLADALPRPAGEKAIAKARRMHLRLGAGGFLAHLARIAALDAAVCTILSRLLRPRLPLASCPPVARVLSRIRFDEARHVALTRSIVLAKGAGASLRDFGADAREALAGVLAIEADAFETLQLDPARLERDIRRLPDGLLRP